MNAVQTDQSYVVGLIYLLSKSLKLSSDIFNPLQEILHIERAPSDLTETGCQGSVHLGRQWNRVAGEPAEAERPTFQVRYFMRELNTSGTSAFTRAKSSSKN